MCLSRLVELHVTTSGFGSAAICRWTSLLLNDEGPQLKDSVKLGVVSRGWSSKKNLVDDVKVVNKLAISVLIDDRIAAHLRYNRNTVNILFCTLFEYVFQTLPRSYLYHLHLQDFLSFVKECVLTCNAGSTYCKSSAMAQVFECLICGPLGDFRIFVDEKVKQRHQPIIWRKGICRRCGRRTGWHGRMLCTKILGWLLFLGCNRRNSRTIGFEDHR
jgi:hypothetical protein